MCPRTANVSPYRYYVAWQAATETFNYPRCVDRSGPLWSPLVWILPARARAPPLRKVALNERQTMFRVMNVRYSHRPIAFSPSSSSHCRPRPPSHPVIAHACAPPMTGDSPWTFEPDPWVANQVPSSRGIDSNSSLFLCGRLCILTVRRMTDQLRGNVRPRILTR